MQKELTHENGEIVNILRFGRLGVVFGTRLCRPSSKMINKNTTNNLKGRRWLSVAIRARELCLLSSYYIYPKAMLEEGQRGCSAYHCTSGHREVLWNMPDSAPCFFQKFSLTLHIRSKAGVASFGLRCFYNNWDGLGLYYSWSDTRYITISCIQVEFVE